jgi:RNA polymerase sigma factor (sigma-70 family)
MNAPLSSLHTEHLAPLLARMQQGDQAAIDELIRRTAIRLEELARRMLRRFPIVRGQVQTGDVVQEASLRLLNALHQVTPGTTREFYGLANRHIRFHLLDLAGHFHQRAHQGLDDHPEPVAAGTGRDEVDEFERWEAFHEAVERLPDEEREVFGLRFYQGFTWPQIADLLEVNERTARRHWDRACLALQDALGGWTPPDEDVPGSFNDHTS